MANGKQHDKNDLLQEASVCEIIVGSRILSICGEKSEIDNGYVYTTVPNVVGIVRAILNDIPKPFILTFPDHHYVTVMLSAAELNDTLRYRILSERRGMSRAVDMHDSHAYIPPSNFR